MCDTGTDSQDRLGNSLVRGRWRVRALIFRAGGMCSLSVGGWSPIGAANYFLAICDGGGRGGGGIRWVSEAAALSYDTLDAALAAIEEHTRGVCRHAP